MIGSAMVMVLLRPSSNSRMWPKMPENVKVKSGISTMRKVSYQTVTSFVLNMSA